MKATCVDTSNTSQPLFNPSFTLSTFLTFERAKKKKGTPN